MKSVWKSAIRLAALLLVTPAALFYLTTALVIGKARAFPGWSQGFSLIPGIAGAYLRQAFYRWVLSGVGTDVWISFGTVLSHATAEFGDRVYVGAGCMLGDVTLEDDVLIGSHVSIINGNRQHGIERLNLPIREQPGEFPRVRIGRDTWIGDRSIVMADVGEQCVIGAGSVVTRPLPSRAVAAGNPARVLRFREEVAMPANDSLETGSPLEARVESVT
jgi:acetyltransferase-like isoleucine patch superfamily enzyme